jgi:hypothetical protein
MKRHICRCCRSYRALTVALLALGASSVFACQVPVFRYALERWESDQYELIVLSDGPVSGEHTAVLQGLDNNQASPVAALRVIDIASGEDSRLRELWQEHTSNSQPVLLTMYPRTSSTPPNQIAHVSPLNAESLARLIQSPARQEVVKRLSEGQSAVWIFLESGSREKDLAALEILEQQLKQDSDWLKLPSPEELEVDPTVLAKAKIKLKIDFSVVSVRRDDPSEKFLVDCLLHSESDLTSFDEPMAFPVFGRGRVLYALVGKGIASDTIRTASAFIVGPCSCQVKNQNPGFDLLLNYNWNDALGDSLISEPIPEANLTPTKLTIPPGRSSR